MESVDIDSAVDITQIKISKFVFLALMRYARDEVIADKTNIMR